MIDLLIRDALVIDGTGAAGQPGNVAIDGGRIVEVGADAGGPARRSFDAAGRVVCPGFFDLHTHYDAQWFWEPTASSSCWHGVTSVLTGNCGFTLAPVAAPEDRDYLQRLFSQVEGVSMELLDSVLDWTWSSFGEYLERIRPELGINVAAQVGHCALRHRVMGAESYERAATPDEIEAMAAELKAALHQGAIGFSTLQANFEVGPYDKPVPSQLATHDELRTLATAMGTAGGGVFTVSPHPGAAHIDATYRELMIELSKLTGSAVVWNAFQHRWDDPEGWRDLLAYMEESSERGGEVYAVAKSQRLDLEFDLIDTRLFVWYPTWHQALSLPKEEKLARFADPELRAALREEFDDSPEAPSQMTARSQIVHFTESRTHPELAGRRVADVAAERGVHVVDAMLDVVVEDRLETRFVYRGLMNGDMDAVGQILRGPRCLPGVSDAGAHLDMDCGVDFSGRLLGHWVREQGIMPLEEAVRRLTSMSAAVLGVNDRGRLEPGLAADVVIFDPDTIAAGPREWREDVPAGGRRIVQRALGVGAVIVNGQVLIEDGVHTGALPGTILERS
ncbi:amidohydrolase family protein [Myxococcota bacterium]|nr:amidohydrolase family protein [Myxococcota bacterium]